MPGATELCYSTACQLHFVKKQKNKNNLLLLPVKEYEDDIIKANKCCLWKEQEQHMNNLQLINSELFVKLISQERNAKQTSFNGNKKWGQSG